MFLFGAPLMPETILHVSLRPWECRDRIESAIDHDGLAALGGMFGSSPVMGIVDEDGFRLQKRLWYNNSCKTFLWGNFVPDKCGTTIVMTSGMQPAVIAFLVVWVAAFTIICGASLVIALGEAMGAGLFTIAGQKALADAGPLFFMIAIGVLIPVVGRWLARNEEVELIQFVIDRLKGQ